MNDTWMKWKHTTHMTALNISDWCKTTTNVTSHEEKPTVLYKCVS